MSKCAHEHELPVMGSTFASTYDVMHVAGAGKPSCFTGTTKARSFDSGGHMSNNGTTFISPPRQFQETMSTAHARALEGSSIPKMELQEALRIASAHQGKRHTTVHARPPGNVMGQAAGASTGKSTTSDCFTLDAAHGAFKEGQTLSAKRAHLFPGALSVASKKELLTLPDGGMIHDVGHAKKSNEEIALKPRKVDANGIPIPPPTRNGVHIDLAPPNALVQAPMHPHALRAMKIRDPVAYHVYVNQKPWVTQSQLIGEHHRTSSAQRRELPPALATDTTNARAALSSGLRMRTEGREDACPTPTTGVARVERNHNLPPVNEFNPIQVNIKDEQVCRIGKRLELEGNVYGQSMSHSIHTNQWLLPERSGTSIPLSKSYKGVKMVTTKAPVDMSGSVAVDSVMTEQGNLVAERPVGVHPSVWRTLQGRAAEAAALGDPHAHKRRVVV